MVRKEPDAPAGPSEAELLTEIRDELRKRRNPPRSRGGGSAQR